MAKSNFDFPCYMQDCKNWGWTRDQVEVNADMPPEQVVAQLLDTVPPVCRLCKHCEGFDLYDDDAKS